MFQWGLEIALPIECNTGILSIRRLFVSSRKLLTCRSCRVFFLLATSQGRLSKRRDIAGPLFAAGAAVALLSDKAESQSCTSPCYPTTTAEAAFATLKGVSTIVVNNIYPPADARRYGCKLDGVATTDTAYMQIAINFCIYANLTLTVNGTCLVTSPINVDRQVDAAAYDKYFVIKSTTGGGFSVNSNISMFS